RDHRHGGNRREADDAVGTVGLRGVDVGRRHDLVHLLPGRAHEAAEATPGLVGLALLRILDDRRPCLHGLAFETRRAPQFEQPPAYQRVLEPVAAVEIPGVRSAPGAAARLVIRHVGAGARVVRLLGLPGDDAALDIDLPTARA